MNTHIQRTNHFPTKWIIAALLAGMLLPQALRAQSTEQTVQSRFLFVFDTSREMKSRGEALQTALNTMLATSLSGQLHAGDSMGVWTFGKELRPGDYPLQTWNPDQAVTIASNLTNFVEKQHYAGDTHFEVLQPLLNQVVQNSQRLTVLIFCDGDAKFAGTPFDAGINQLLDQKQSDQKKAGQPFVIVLRSQLGQYVACSVGLPPQLMSYPQFPPLPPPPALVAPKATNAPPPPAPVAMSQPLIIIGTKTETSPPPPQAASATPTNPPAINQSAKSEAPTNAPVPPPVIPVATNPVAQTAAPTNSIPPPPSTSSGNQSFLIIGSGLFGAAIALGLVFWLRPRPKDPSLISRSMNDRK
jgi:hypothetical protein